MTGGRLKNHWMQSLEMFRYALTLMLLVANLANTK